MKDKAKPEVFFLVCLFFAAADTKTQSQRPFVRRLASQRVRLFAPAHISIAELTDVAAEPSAAPQPPATFGTPFSFSTAEPTAAQNPRRELFFLPHLTRGADQYLQRGRRRAWWAGTSWSSTPLRRRMG
jgi:hypothetical protein